MTENIWLMRPLRLTHGDTWPVATPMETRGVGQTASRFSAVPGPLEMCVFFCFFLGAERKWELFKASVAPCQ